MVKLRPMKNLSIFTAGIVAGFALFSPLESPAASGDDVSNSTVVFLRPEETSFWRTATNAVISLPVSMPPLASSAVLTVVGVDYRREYEIEASGDYELRLPPVDSFNAENVYELTLRFNDGTVQTARIGHVRSYSAEGGEGAITRVLSPVGDAKWNVVKKRAVMPVIYGTTSFKVNGAETDTGLDGAQGWYALKVATDISALLEVAVGGSVSSASLLGRGPGCFVILR